MQEGIKYFILGCALCAVVMLSGCRSTSEWRAEADRAAVRRLSEAQKTVTGRVEPIEVESASDSLRRRLLLDQHLATLSNASLGVRDLEDGEHWRGAEHLREGRAYKSNHDTTGVVVLSLTEAVMIAAANSPSYQEAKDTLFKKALALDLEEHEFQNSFAGMLKESYSSTHNGEGRTRGLAGEAIAGVNRTFKNGAELAASLSVDLVKLLTGTHGSSWGVSADASVSIPLLRGSGAFVVTEPLTAAQRNLVYGVRDFEQYKREFVVSIATAYLGVLRTGQTVKNQEENYKRVVTSTRRSRRMADAGLLPENQFDQAVQDELSARDNWITAKQSHQGSLDSFRILLGLPPDAEVTPDNAELERLLKYGESLGGDGEVTDYGSGDVPPADAPVELRGPGREGAGAFEIEEGRAVRLALTTRPDLRNTLEQIWDRQRAVLIAEDALRAELTLGVSSTVGESRSLAQADLPDGTFRPNRAGLSAPLAFDFAWERTRERNAYRNSLIALEQAVRTFQSAEDAVKKDIRSDLRTLLENRSSIVIQRQAVKLAKRRVDSTGLLLQAGRAEIRDVLEAQSALLSAQNSLISALVSYRLAELGLQRDLGVLNVTVDGRWAEGLSVEL